MCNEIRWIGTFDGEEFCDKSEIFPLIEYKKREGKKSGGLKKGGCKKIVVIKDEGVKKWG